MHSQILSSDSGDWEQQQQQHQQPTIAHKL